MCFFREVVPVRSDSTPQEVAAVRAAAKAAGVKSSMLIGGPKLDLGLEAAVEDYRRLIDNAAALGATWLLNGGTSQEAHYETFFELMRRAAPYFSLNSRAACRSMSLITTSAPSRARRRI